MFSSTFPNFNSGPKLSQSLVSAWLDSGPPMSTRRRVPLLTKMQMNMDPNGQSPWFTTSGTPDNAYPPMNNSGVGGGAMGVGPGHTMGPGGRMGAPMTPGTFPAPISTSSSMGGDEYQYNDEEDYENEPPLLEGKRTLPVACT